MSETEIVIVDRVLPRIRSIRARDNHTAEIVWEDGLRSGHQGLVDLSPLIFEMKVYGPLRDNLPLFRTIHLIRHGTAIAWGANDEIDMAATSVERLASNTPAPEASGRKAEHLIAIVR